MKRWLIFLLGISKALIFILEIGQELLFYVIFSSSSFEIN